MLGRLREIERYQTYGRELMR
jgi:hypothetical protein